MNWSTLTYLVKKGLILLLSLFVVITLSFFLMHAIPGDPFTHDQAIPEEILKVLKSYYGLDEPLITQYGRYLDGILHFDLGPSLKYEGRTVNGIIAETFPVSFVLGLEALFISIVGGITLGVIASFYHLQWQDKVALLIAVLGISIPSFLLDPFLQYFLSIKFDLLPLARWGTFSHTVMPAITLAVFPLAFIARLTRSSILEVLQQDYILVARAKGLSSFHILYHHVAKNALLPVIAYLGPLCASIFTGSFVVEKILAFQG